MARMYIKNWEKKEKKVKNKNQIDLEIIAHK